MKSLLLASAVLASTFSISSAGPTDDTYAKTHPRIHEVNARLRTQNARIDAALAAGTITATQAAALHTEDAAIKAEETTDASLDKGHLTKADDEALNQQLNVVSKEIGGDTHPRIAEVIARLDAQDKRIDAALAAGAITATQAAALHTEDAAIKAEEKTDASLDKGHLTKADDEALNQQLNVVSKEIVGDTHPRITEVIARLDAQDKRIDAALADGKITAEQAAALHAEDAKIKAEEKTDASLDNGHLTKADDEALNQQLNAVSKQIGDDTHPRIAEINARLDAQDKRIDAALAAGKITAEEAAALHAEDAAIKTEEKIDASLDKGHLTKADDEALNQQLNAISTQIGGDTHPRIAEVDARLDAQDKRIDAALAAGKITATEATEFHAEDAKIKAEEKTEASLDGGHITRVEKHSLDGEISSVGHQIASASGSSSGSGSHGSSRGGHK